MVRHPSTQAVRGAAGDRAGAGRRQKRRPGRRFARAAPRELPPEIGNALHWVSNASRPLSDLADLALARLVLDSLKVKLDGTTAAAETVQRKRRTLVNAVDLGECRGSLADARCRMTSTTGSW